MYNFKNVSVYPVTDFHGDHFCLKWSRTAVFSQPTSATDGFPRTILFCTVPSSGIRQS